MTQRIVEDAFARNLLHAFIDRQDMPFTVSISTGGRRSAKQNRLAHKWYGEIAIQLPGTYDNAEDARGYCKLHFGVPIIRAVDEDFRQAYDEKIRPAPYEFKIALMKVPFDWPITSKMNTKQLTEYLDAVHRHFSEQGVVLTIPEDKGLGWRPAPPVTAYEDA